MSQGERCVMSWPILSLITVRLAGGFNHMDLSGERHALHWVFQESKDAMIFHWRVAQ